MVITLLIFVLPRHFCRVLIVADNTGLFEMIVGVLTTCHTHT